MTAPAPAHRSGACKYDDRPAVHAVCSGMFTHYPLTASPKQRRCACPCHAPEGAHMRRDRPVKAGAR